MANRTAAVEYVRLKSVPRVPSLRDIQNPR
jgi:hypothetical protein